MSRLNGGLWRLVDAVHRLPRTQRLAVKALCLLAILGVVYLWTSALDCPFC